MREGPSVVQITHQSCFDCVHHGRFLIRTGRDPEYENTCNHPENGDTITRYLMGYRGRVIGRSDETPSWCPVMAKGGTDGTD